MRFAFLLWKAIMIQIFISFLVLCIFISPVASQDSTGTVADIDGNVYRTIKIGSQWWMAENLRVIHYQNGEIIPKVPLLINWRYSTKDAFGFYNNDAINYVPYGCLYNWYAANSKSKICSQRMACS